MNLLSGVWIICLGQVLLQFIELRCNNTRQNRQIMSHKKYIENIILKTYSKISNEHATIQQT